ncbi:MAG: hypothetical protein WB543_20480, partial [Candidatus Acidiferrum sp.]
PWNPSDIPDLAPATAFLGPPGALELPVSLSSPMSNVLLMSNSQSSTPVRAASAAMRPQPAAVAPYWAHKTLYPKRQHILYLLHLICLTTL